MNTKVKAIYFHNEYRLYTEDAWSYEVELPYGTYALSFKHYKPQLVYEFMVKKD
jgi:hypothetical protein